LAFAFHYVAEWAKHAEFAAVSLLFLKKMHVYNYAHAKQLEIG
jgi:hypothetical protein